MFRRLWSWARSIVWLAVAAIVLALTAVVLALLGFTLTVIFAVGILALVLAVISTT